MKFRFSPFVAGLAASCLFGFTLPVFAQHADHDMSKMSGMSSAAPESVSGEVRAIDTKAHKITLKHGAMAGMPAMTMMYPYKADITLPANLKQGDAVRFQVQDIAGMLTVTSIQR